MQLSHLQVLPLGPTLQVGLLSVSALGKGLSEVCSVASLPYSFDHMVQISPLLHPLWVGWSGIVVPTAQGTDLCAPISTLLWDIPALEQFTSTRDQI